ncbi:MAG: nuclear transport factor 2 family protein [Flavipsychrobacter sp.]|nr:nuclear transport factor 2 family protein [Flavipsychrobacter sp.]
MMKKIALLVTVLVMATMITFAQTKDEKSLVKAVESFRKALIDPDSTVLKQLVSDKVSYGHSSGVVQNRAALIEALLSGRSDFVTIDITGQTMEVFDNVAIVRHTLSATTNDNGKPGIVKLTVMLVWKKSHNKWILIARQAVHTA